MNLKRAVGLILLLIPLQTGWAEEADKLAQSRASALAWLALIDGGDYERSWSEASSLFQVAISSADWARALRGARGPVGDLQSRADLSATHTTSLPGAPDGEYVVMQFKSSFGRKAEAVETVTTMLESNGTWKVSGYFIK
jgi:hypothetical protein